MKIAYVVDTKVSALGIAATSRARSNPEVSVIEGLNFVTPGHLSNHLSRGNYDLVIFSWRFLAYELLSFRHLRGAIRKLSRDSSLALVIPDHLGSDGDLAKKEAALIKSIDYFLVTSEVLFRHYSEKYPNKCKGILHDMPDLESLQVARHRSKPTSEKMIWVGNSQWGERMGFKDHKRFNEIVKVLLSRNQNIHIIDASVRRLSNVEVLNEVRESTYLIQCSKSEGTGMPVLEAAAVGTIPITTVVGVSKELLIGDLIPLLVDPDVVSFEKTFKWAMANKSWLPSKLIERFDEYIQGALLEEIFYPSEAGEHIIEQSFSKEIRSYCKWMLRSLIYKFKSLKTN